MFLSSTSNSDQSKATRFIARLLVFLAPVLVAAAVFEYAMYRTGDSWPINRVVQAQSKTDEGIFGRAYFSQQYNIYKSQVIRQRRPAILTLGSSRVMEFRNLMFHPHEQSFYNGGGMIQSIYDLAAYSRQVREAKLPVPRVVIVGIEPWWLSKDARGQGRSWLDERAQTDSVYSFSAHVEAARTLLKTGKRNFPWRVAFARSPRLTPRYGYEAVGIAALAVGGGERFSDGSHLYEKEIAEFIERPEHKDRMTPTVLQRVRNNSDQFAPSDGLDAARTALLIESLTSLKSLGAEVYAYLPPFSGEVTQALNESSALSRWWDEYRHALPEELKAAGIPCMPLSQPADYGLDDTYMFDGFHPSEVYNAYILEDLIRQSPPESMLASVDLNHLVALRSNDKALPLCFFPPDKR
jgi:hypothetical protein